MPIRKIDTTGAWYGGTPGEVETHFWGRVIRVEKVTENRNWSDTLDYSDWRTTTCTYALVYLGTHGVPAHRWSSDSPRMRPRTNLEPSSYDTPRDLAPEERFAWIDCTNLFTDRTGYELRAEADTFDMQLLFCGPNITEELAAFEAAEAALVAAHEEKLRLEVEKIQAKNAKLEARREKAAAKDVERKAAAEALLARAPKKGTNVTLGDFTGTVFWTGVTKYRGKWGARYGVKDRAGRVVWSQVEAG